MKLVGYAVMIFSAYGAGVFAGVYLAHQMTGGSLASVQVALGLTFLCGVVLREAAEHL